MNRKSVVLAKKANRCVSGNNHERVFGLLNKTLDNGLKLAENTSTPTQTDYTK